MSAPQEGIFRQQSIEKLSSPEQLDQLMHVTESRGWLALAAIGVLLATALVWGVFGRIATKVHGSGILIRSGGVVDVVALGHGQIEAIYVDVGQEVQRGQIVARIAQPDLQQQIDKSKADLEELRAQQARIEKLESTDTELRAGYAEKQRQSLLNSIASDQSRVGFLMGQMRTQQQLFRDGLVTKQQLEATRQELEMTRKAIRDAQSQLQSLNVGTQEVAGQKEKELLQFSFRINDAVRQLEILEERLDLNSKVIAPETGRVIEIRASEGDLANPGRPVISIQPTGSEGLELQALIYVPLGQGKLVKPGMRVQVSPASVKREEHGVMVGIVTSVSEFPSTEAGMNRVLGNELLVRNLLQTVGLAPIAVETELVPDPETASGYRWSSKEGPPLQLGPGTPCDATISVRQTRPIERVIPLIREILGG